MALAPRTLEPLVVGKVIGDVVDMFIPAAGLKVSYGTKEVFNGCDIKVIGTVDRPFVQVDDGRPSSNLYTLIMVDPDYPSPSEPTLREWLHWMVTDIPGGSDATRGKEMVGYVGPQPPTGIHRYVFVLYKQKTAFSGVCPSPGSRSNFSSRLFSAVNDLGFPVAVVYFNSQKEPVNKKKQPAKRKLP